MSALLSLLRVTAFLRGPRWLLVALLATAAAGDALANGRGEDATVFRPAREGGDHMLELGAARASVGSYFRQAPLRTLVELGYRHQPRSGWVAPVSLGGGLRLGLPAARATLPVEAFGSVGLNAVWGFWEPALTLELGVSGLTDVVPRPGYPSDPIIPGEEGLPPAYFAFEAEPLRARFGRFTVSALALQWGTSLLPTGQTLRLQLGFLKVGVTL